MRPLFPPLLLLLPVALANPCDIFASTGTPCVAAHSTVRALYAAYSGPLYQLRRAADNATLDIHPLAPGGFADSASHDAFCSGGPPPPPSPPLVGMTVSLVPSSLQALSFRHCYSQAFVTPLGEGNDQDHSFKVVAALDGDENALSFQSINYPALYIGPVTTAEPGRLGIVEPSVPGDVSWTVTPVVPNGGGGGSAGAVTLTLASRGGLAMSVGTNLTGTCASSYSPPSAGVFLEDAGGSSSPPPQSATWILNTTGGGGYPLPAACQVWALYDQSPMNNTLSVAGPAINNPNFNNPVNATRFPVQVGGHKVYAAFFETGMGYRIANTTGVAVGNEPETLYMVTSGTHVNSGCCFDYGNAESDPTNSSTFHDGTMESINFSVTDVTGTWCGGAGHTGPWVMADLENGLWACGGNMTQNANNIPLPFPFVTAMVKGGVSGFALKGGDATAPGNLTLLYDGPRPPGYQPMRKQGAIILGIGGDSSHNSMGVFLEGAIVANYTDDAVDAAVHANIIAANIRLAAGV